MVVIGEKIELPSEGEAYNIWQCEEHTESKKGYIIAIVSQGRQC